MNKDENDSSVPWEPAARSAATVLATVLGRTLWKRFRRWRKERKEGKKHRAKVLKLWQKACEDADIHQEIEP